LNEKDVTKLFSDRIIAPALLMENLYISEISKTTSTAVLKSLPSWNDLLAKVFGLYMDWVRKGAKLQTMSTQMVADFSPYYDAKKCDISKVTFGYAPQLAKKLNSPNLGITDGYKIMFGNTDYVKTFSSATKLTKLNDGEVYWMAHELAHCEQYAGSQKKYAVRWFNELFDYAASGFVSDFWKALKKAIWTWDFDPLIAMMAPEKMAQYDDNMPLEKEAYKKGMNVVGEVSKIRAKEQIKIEIDPKPIIKPVIVQPIKFNP